MYPVLYPAHTGGAEYSIELDKVGPTVQFCGCANIEKELGLNTKFAQFSQGMETCLTKSRGMAATLPHVFNN